MVPFASKDERTGFLGRIVYATYEPQERQWGNVLTGVYLGSWQSNALTLNYTPVTPHYILVGLFKAETECWNLFVFVRCFLDHLRTLLIKFYILADPKRNTFYISVHDVPWRDKGWFVESLTPKWEDAITPTQHCCTNN